MICLIGHVLMLDILTAEMFQITYTEVNKIIYIYIYIFFVMHNTVSYFHPQYFYPLVSALNLGPI